LLVVLQFLTQPGSQYIFAPFAVAPIGQLYLMIHRALGSLRVLPQKLEYGKRRRIAPYVLQHAVGQQQLPECAVPARMDRSSQSRRMWRRRAQSRCRCGGGEPSPGADVAGVSPVPAQMWRGLTFPGADVAGVSPVPAQMSRASGSGQRGAEGRPGEPGVLTLTKTDGVDLRGDYAAPRAPASLQTLPCY
jgi:hypothetical protein